MKIGQSDQKDSCPNCETSFHLLHLSMWIMKSNICPHCKNSFSDDFVEPIRSTHADWGEEAKEIVNIAIERYENEKFVRDLKQSRRSCSLCHNKENKPDLFCSNCYSVYHKNHLNIWKTIINECIICRASLEDVIGFDEQIPPFFVDWMKVRIIIGGGIIAFLVLFSLLGF